MEISRLLRNDCPNVFDCPKVYELSDGRLAIQGDRADPELLASLNLPPHETMVIVPRSLLPEV
jgi:hypothetical protein